MVALPLAGKAAACQARKDLCPGRHRPRDSKELSRRLVCFQRDGLPGITIGIFPFSVCLTLIPQAIEAGRPLESQRMLRVCKLGSKDLPVNSFRFLTVLPDLR
jgi:hypothetical protein